MDKCRLCLQCRKNVLSLNAKANGITFADMISSISNVQIRNEDGFSDKICRSCRIRLTDAYNFKIDIERSDMILQETSNLKRINFSNINDIKIKIEIETDFKPLMPSINLFSDKLLKGGQCLAYNNTLIKKIDNSSEGDDYNTMKSLSVGEFLNSIKIESDNNCDYQNFDIGAHYNNSDTESDFSFEKEKKKCTKKGKAKERKKSKPHETKWSKQVLDKPIQPKYIGDVRLVRTESETLKLRPRKPKKKSADYLSPNVCPYCGKLTKSLNSHILMHTEERAFKCDQCPKSFHTATRLKTHVNLHSQIKKFKCDQCIAAFHNKSSLTSHMLMHREERKFICDICSKSFKRKPILMRHKLIHNFGNRPIQCELCPMTFNTQYNLRHHMRVHTGERPFRCEICSQPYSYKHDFNRHCLKKHGVFLKRRSVRVMNEEVLQQERALMRDLSLRVHGIIKDDEIVNPFDGPQAAQAYEHAKQAIEANKIPIVY